MKSFLASLVCFASLATSASALSFVGTITQTVTNSNDPLYHVGDTFIGWYRYESPAINGEFNTNVFPPPGENSSLIGSIYFAFVPRPNETPNGYRPLNSTPFSGELIVSGGQVTSFNWSFENGGYYMSASTGGFLTMSYYDRPILDQSTGQFLPTPIVTGSLGFSAPHVPEAATTAPLLLAGLAGLASLARRSRARLAT
ncbi:MAG: hypothetical protein NTV51_30580 [Verrucomicrobia bacterium]|nr:hypothetical protein [Verrucomicrobiota bacterium]